MMAAGFKGVIRVPAMKVFPITGKE